MCIRDRHYLDHLTVKVSSYTFLNVWRRGQVAKAADCKSAIPGSNPGVASKILSNEATSQIWEVAFFVNVSSKVTKQQWFRTQPCA